MEAARDETCKRGFSMLYIDTCVLLAVLTPAAHSATATAFLAQASAPMAISSWSVTELHSALGLKVRTKALSHAQAEAVMQGSERSLAPDLLVLELELEPQDFRNANALHLAIASGRGPTAGSGGSTVGGRRPADRQSASSVPSPGTSSQRRNQPTSR
jgi:hypothetical protein